MSSHDATMFEPLSTQVLVETLSSPTLPLITQRDILDSLPESSTMLSEPLEVQRPKMFPHRLY